MVALDLKSSSAVACHAITLCCELPVHFQQDRKCNIEVLNATCDSKGVHHFLSRCIQIAKNYWWRWLPHCLYLHLTSGMRKTRDLREVDLPIWFFSQSCIVWTGSSCRNRGNTLQTLQKYYSNSVGNPLLYPSSLHSQNLFFCIRVPPQKIVHPLDPQSLQIRNRLIRDSGAPRFIFVVYWLELLVSVWLVFIVMVLVVSCLFGFVSSPIVTVSQIHFIFLFLCIFDDGKTSTCLHDCL